MAFRNPVIEQVETRYQGWGRLLIATLRTPEGDRITREIDDHGDAVAVLPYDPARGTVMLIRQPRPPLLLRGQADPILEVPAGRIETGDGIKDTARREVMEECGLRIDALELVGHFHAMPAVSTEQISLYLASYAQADRIAAGGGLAEEHEAIEIVEMPLAELSAMGMAALADMKTAVLVLALRERLAAQSWPPASA